MCKARMSRGGRTVLLACAGMSGALWGASFAEACLVRTRMEIALDLVTTVAAGTATVLAGLTIAARWAARARRERTEEMLIAALADTIRRDGPPTGPMGKLKAL